MYSYVVRLNNITFIATHGLHEHEKDNPQKFEVDLEVYCRKEEAFLDDIENSINYEDLYEITRGIIQNNTFNLLETIGEKVIQKILYRYDNSIESVVITLRKPQINLDNNLNCIEVSINKTNE